MEERIETTYALDQTNVMLSNVCRVCLQDSADLISIYEKSSIENEFSYAEKIMQVINSINLKKKANLPQQICTNCVSDLNAAYRFKMNCESTEAILQSYIAPNSEENEEINEEIDEQEGDFYTYKSEMVDTEIIVAGSDHLDKDLTDVLGKCDDNEEVVLDLIDDVKVHSKPRKEPTKEKTSRSKRNSNQSIDKDQEKLHICEICANQYKFRHALEVHMRRHNNVKPFQCEYCQRSFVIRFELKRHMRVHTGVKPYSCRFCERKFSDFGSRIKHERSHTGNMNDIFANNIKIPITRTFIKKNMKNNVTRGQKTFNGHFFRVIGERPYICQTCGKTFAYSHVLSGHLLTHTGEKRFLCQVCNKRFTKSHHLKSHMKTHFKTLTKQQQQEEQQPTIQLAQEPIKEEQELLNIVYM